MSAGQHALLLDGVWHATISGLWAFDFDWRLGYDSSAAACSMFGWIGYCVGVLDFGFFSLLQVVGSRTGGFRKAAVDLTGY